MNYAPAMTKTEEIEFLRNRSQGMKKQLEQIQSRMQQLGIDLED
jgi:hypothetical protein